MQFAVLKGNYRRTPYSLLRSHPQLGCDSQLYRIGAVKHNICITITMPQAGIE